MDAVRFFSFLAAVSIAMNIGAQETPSSPYGKEFVRHTMTVDDFRLSYLYRSGEGIPLVLIPGSFSDSAQWVEVVDGLDPKLPLVLIELRGHGGSWPPDPNGSIELFARDVLRSCDDCNISDFYVGGHSIGGMVAIEVGRAASERVKGIISIEGWTNHHAAREAFDGVMRNTLTEELEAERIASRKRVLAHWTEEQVKTFATHWRQWDGLEFLQITKIPVLEIYGDRGKPKPTLDKLYIPERDNISVVWIENACHSLPLERPRRLAELTMEFIQNRENRSAKSTESHQ